MVGCRGVHQKVYDVIMVDISTTSPLEDRLSNHALKIKYYYAGVVNEIFPQKSLVFRDNLAC
jgi:hypothetical protein